MEGGEGPKPVQPSPREGELQKSPAEIAANLVIGATLRYPATDYGASTHIALACKKRSLDISIIGPALLTDQTQLQRIADEANRRHTKAIKQGKIQSEPFTLDDARVLASNDIRIAGELSVLTVAELQSVLDYVPPGYEDRPISRTTMDYYRGEYAKTLIRSHPQSEEN